MAGIIVAIMRSQMIKSYSELVKFKTFIERFNYLRISSSINLKSGKDFAGILLYAITDAIWELMVLKSLVIILLFIT